MSSNIKDRKMARRIAESVHEKGGTVYYVGGYVRDKLLGKQNKDIDVEVHGVTPSDLRAILDGFGTVKTQGASFGVYNLKGYDIDIAQPRMESAVGRGHKDFEVYVDPFIGVEKAAMRRDFTMNAMMQNVLTGEIVDPFGGREDLKNGVIRHVNDKTFVEDPLRVFRAAQFASRFGFEIAPETLDLMQTMDLSTLSKERVYEEMNKALMKADKPSIFFDALRKTGQLDVWFPEMKALIDCPQDPVYHPEGDVWNHTMMVLDNAAGCRDKVTEPEYFMVSSICHDMGKPDTLSVTEDGHIHTYGHDKAGVAVADRFLKRLNNDNALRGYVLDMVENHMKPHQCFNNESHIKTTNHMFDNVKNRSDLCHLVMADISGKGSVTERALKEQAFLSERLAIYEARAKEPMVTGKDLITIGMKPSREFSEILESSRKMHFSGVDKDAVIKDIVSKNKNAVNTEKVDELLAQIQGTSDDSFSLQKG